MELNLKNKIALVTGASQGIGKAIAIQLAKEGACIAITSNDESKLAEVVDEIKKFNADVIYVSGNAESENDINETVAMTAKRFGQIDILVNNVGGISEIHSFEEITTEEWMQSIRLNIMSGIHFSNAVLPHMKKSQWGRIIFLSSEKGIEPGVNMSQYSMCKTALLSLSKSLANELGQYGITVNTVSPGVIPTPAWDKNANVNNMSRDAYAAKFCRNVLAENSLGQPEDVASLVSYLCSECARWITGSNFRVDGGSVKNIQL